MKLLQSYCFIILLVLANSASADTIFVGFSGFITDAFDINGDEDMQLINSDFEGYFFRLATLKDFEWQRENKQVTFDQATNLTKFTRNVELMRMGESA